MTRAVRTGRYLEDFTVGERIDSAEHVVRESDVLGFAELTGDHNPLHTDPGYAATGPFGTRIAHGLLGMALAVGLLERTGVHDGTSLAMLAVDEWRFHVPVRLGATVRASMTVLSQRVSKQDPARGILVRRLDLRDDAGVLLQDGTVTLLVRCRPPE